MNYFEKASANQQFEEFIDTNASVDFIRHVWIDLSGVLRARILTKTYCKQIYASNRRYGVGPGAMIQVMSEADEHYPAPWQVLMELVPDWNSLRLCHFSPGHAWVMCFVYCVEGPEPLSQCPRFLLGKTMEQAKHVTDAEFLVGCEIEFMLMDANKQPLHTLDDIESWSVLAGLRDKKLEMMEEIVRVLQTSGIEVSHFHTEAFQQLEFSTYPYDPMKAADVLMYTYECLRTVATRYGYRATVAVKPLHTSPTTTTGLHFSISKHEEADHFLAGILHKLPLIVPFAMPTHDSYRRQSVDRKGTWVCWGTQNRDVPIRKVEQAHWELRLSDPTANFYLLIAVLMKAGMDGIKNKQPLIWQDVRYFSSQMKDEELAALNVTERLPSSLRDSIELLRRSTELDEFLGSDLKRLYLHVKELDEDVFCRMTDEERRKLYIKYF